MIRKCYRK